MRRTLLAAALAAVGLVLLGPFPAGGRAPGRRPTVPAPGPAAHPPRLRGTGAPPGNGGGPPAAAGRRVMVRDLADGAPVGGVEIRIAVGDRPAEARHADAAGALGIPADAHVVAAAAPWRLAAPAPDAEGTVWMHREIEVVGLVHVAGAPAGGAGALVEARVLGAPGHDVDRPAPAPWRADWARDHGLGAPVRTRADAAGRFALRVPAVRGLVVQASRARHVPAWVEVVPPTPPRDRVDVRLELRPAHRVRGRLLDAEDRPLAGASVVVHVLHRVGARGLDLDRLALHGMPYGADVRPDGRAHVEWQAATRTDADGRFEAWVAVDGEARVEARLEGHAPVRAPLGTLDGDREGVHLEAAHQAPEALRVTMDGVPCRDGTLVVTDVTDDPWQGAFTLRLDPEGRARTAWLERGRRYWLVAGATERGPDGAARRRTASCFLTWDGRDEVALEAAGPARVTGGAPR